MDRVFNLISLIFLVLTILVVVWGVAQMANPPQVAQDVGELPALLVLPSVTPSFTPTNTPIPTWTFTPTETETPTLTPTETFTLAPTVTITDTAGPTDTPSITPTPSVSPTFTPTVTPTGPTATFTATVSPFPFVLRDNQVIFTSNFANTAGCAWQGMGGQVFDLNDQPLVGVRVHVFDGFSVDLYATSGTNTLYGTSGWEIPVETTISTKTYLIELQSPQGTVISPTVQVTFPQDCARNLAIVNFEQTRPF